MKTIVTHRPMFTNTEDVLMKSVASVSALFGFVHGWSLSINASDIQKLSISLLTAALLGGSTMLGGLLTKLAWKHLTTFFKARTGWRLKRRKL